MRPIRYLISSALLAASNVQAEPPTEWVFDVYLDSKRIGEHRFVQSGDAANHEMDIRADFKATLFLVVPFEYTHRNREVWRDGCLASLTSTTDDDGEKYRVDITTEGSRYKISTRDGSSSGEGCLSTFAYWNEDFLNNSMLVNSQDGKLSAIKVKKMQGKTLSWRGKDIATTHYQVIADPIEINLWYDAQGEWLALESPVKGGMTLRYQRKP